MSKEWVNKEDIYDVDVIRHICYDEENKKDKNSPLILYDYDESYIPSMRAADKLMFDTLVEAIKYRKDNNFPIEAIVTSVSNIDKLRRHIYNCPINFSSPAFMEPIKVNDDYLKIEIDDLGTTNEFRFKLLPRIKEVAKTLQESSYWIRSYGNNREYKFIDRQ